MPRRVSSASSVRTAVRRASSSGVVAALKDLRFVSLEPPALLQRAREHALELGRHPGDAALGRAEALRIGQGLECGVHLRVRELALGHAADNR